MKRTFPPFVRIVLPYLAGGTFALYLSGGMRAITGAAILAVGFGVAGSRRVWRRKPRRAAWYFFVALSSLGAMRFWIAALPTPLSAWVGKEVHFEGYLAYQPDLPPQPRAVMLIAQLQREGRTCREKVWWVSHDPLPDTRYGATYRGKGRIERPSPARNPGGYDARRDLARRGVQFVLKSQESILLENPRGHPLLRWIDRLRRRVEFLLDQHAGHPLYAAVLRGMLLGQRRGIPQATLRSVRDSGLFHLFAISGLHVGFVVGSVYLLLELLRFLPERIKLALTMMTALLYASLVGFRASAVRATLLIEIVLFARFLYRDAHLLNALAIAAMGLLLWNPLLMLDYGFQLSFLVVLAIIAFVPRWWAWLRGTWEGFAWLERHGTLRGLNWLLQAFLVSLAAQVASQPLLGYHFFRVYPLALMANLPAALFAWWTVMTGLLTVLMGLLWSPLANLVGYAMQLGLALLIGWSDWIAGLPGAVTDVTRSQAIALFTLPLLAIGITYGAWFCQPRWRLGFVALALPGMLWWGVIPERFPGLEVTFLDVGHGDSIVVRFPKGGVWLIDAGPRTPSFDAGESIVAPYLRYENIRRLDRVLITHPESDHRGGLAYLREHFRIGQVLGLQRELPLNLPAPSPTVSIEVLHPSPAFLSQPGIKANDRSLVLRLRYGQVSFLFTGDIEAAAERWLCDHRLDLRSTVLKVAHHGSATSSSEDFLNAVSPRLVVISCGRPPQQVVLERLKQLGVRTFRTDKQGAIRIRTDGQRCWVTPWID